MFRYLTVVIDGFSEKQVFQNKKALPFGGRKQIRKYTVTYYLTKEIPKPLSDRILGEVGF